jgi:hypothetical protein
MNESMRSAQARSKIIVKGTKTCGWIVIRVKGITKANTLMHCISQSSILSHGPEI